jgi:hypothetical protein
MTLRPLLCALLVLSMVLGVSTRALAQPARTTDPRAQVEALRKESRFTFCTKPKSPLFGRQRELCTLASQVPECEGFATACGDPALKEADKKESKSSDFGGVLGAIAKLLIWVLVIAVVVAIAFPLIRAFMRSRRDKELADVAPEPNVAVAVVKKPPPEAELISDAEAALREADEHARRGDLARALSLYLAASLAALDRRGAIRLARHRTNGEYVRACSEDGSQQSLREIVREVDKVEFGKLAPTGDGVARVASRASAVVRAPAGRGASVAAAGLFVLLLVLTGCGPRSHAGPPIANDPAGDELPMELLRRSGYAVSYLPTSIAALPMPSETTSAPIVVIDVANVTLEEESEAHLIHWVEGGGVLVLLGPALQWPAELHVEPDHASTRRFDVLTEDVVVQGALAATPRALKWANADPIAMIGKSVYAARKDIGKGSIVGVAGDELFTNIGAAGSANAEALVALIDIAAQDRNRTDVGRGVAEPAKIFEIHVARDHDGVPPPSNPFSALVQAGLGKGAWHALAAAVVLFLAFGIRHARARPAVPPARRAFAEHVEATGAFYGRARALGHALACYGRFAEMRLRERVPRGGDPVAFLAARAQVPHADAARVWRRATEANAHDLPQGDELTTIRDLRAMLVKALETG